MRKDTKKTTENFTDPLHDEERFEDVPLGDSNQEEDSHVKNKKLGHDDINEPYVIQMEQSTQVCRYARYAFRPS